jgi:hypothetical protein
MFGPLTDRLPDHLSPDRLRAQLSRARDEVAVARAHGSVKLWTLGADGLERAHNLLDNAPEPLAAPLRRVVDGGLQQVTGLPVDDYDALNVRRVDAAIRGLGHIDLARVERYERAGKARKTVLRAIERERLRLEAPRQAA